VASTDAPKKTLPLNTFHALGPAAKTVAPRKGARLHLFGPWRHELWLL
jgi:hypothetical protein